MHDILQDFSAPFLLKAMEANVQQALLRLGRGLGAVVYDEPELQYFISGIPFHLANGIVRATFSSDSMKKFLEAKLTQLASYNVPMVWLTGPSTLPTAIGSFLEARGWMRDDAPGMAIDLHPLDEHVVLPRLIIERVGNEAMLKTWLRVMTVSSEIPEEGLTLLLDMVGKHGYKNLSNVYFYLGTLDSKPVATSLLYLGGGVAGIYNVATLPEFRKQGIGRALTLAPLLEARASGYRIGVLQSTQMGLDLYRSIGFREYCTFSAYFSPVL